MSEELVFLERVAKACPDSKIVISSAGNGDVILKVNGVAFIYSSLEACVSAYKSMLANIYLNQIINSNK